MNPESFVPSPDDTINLLKLNIQEAVEDGTLRGVASVYDLENQTIIDDYDAPGKKIITFSHILNHDRFPLAEILDNLLQLGQKAMYNRLKLNLQLTWMLPQKSCFV
jgi:hypothetical protein